MEMTKIHRFFAKNSTPFAPNAIIFTSCPGTLFYDGSKTHDYCGDNTTDGYCNNRYFTQIFFGPLFKPLKSC